MNQLTKTIAVCAGAVVLACSTGCRVERTEGQRHQARAIDSILLTGTISFLTGTALLLALFLAGRALGRVRPTPADLKGAPWWIWIGGLCASVFVTGTFVLVQRLGAAPAIGLAVGGQQVASLVIDRFGLFGLPRRNLTPGRVGGVAALLLGVALVEAG